MARTICKPTYVVFLQPDNCISYSWGYSCSIHWNVIKYTDKMEEGVRAEGFDIQGLIRKHYHLSLKKEIVLLCSKLLLSFYQQSIIVWNIFVFFFFFEPNFKKFLRKEYWLVGFYFYSKRDNKNQSGTEK